MGGSGTLALLTVSATLGGVLAGIIMWAVTLALFAIALFTIKLFGKRKNKA